MVEILFAMLLVDLKFYEFMSKRCENTFCTVFSIFSIRKLHCLLERFQYCPLSHYVQLRVFMMKIVFTGFAYLYIGFLVL